MVETNPALGRSLGRDHHPQAFTMWLAGGGIKPGIDLRRDRRPGLPRRRKPGPRPRPAGHDPAPAGLRPREADLPPRRPRLPADRRAREGGQGNPGVIVQVSHLLLMGSGTAKTSWGNSGRPASIRERASLSSRCRRTPSRQCQFGGMGRSAPPTRSPRLSATQRSAPSIERRASPSAPESLLGHRHDDRIQDGMIPGGIIF